ncbi:hypothetical protein PAMP_007596 [Pampus punctatissimus]
MMLSGLVDAVGGSMTGKSGHPLTGSWLQRRKTVSDGIDMQLNKGTNRKSSCTGAHCLGFGKWTAVKWRPANHGVQKINSNDFGEAVPASIPLIRETDLTRAGDPLFSFTCGSLTFMTKLIRFTRSKRESREKARRTDFPAPKNSCPLNLHELKEEEEGGGRLFRHSSLTADQAGGGFLPFLRYHFLFYG